MGLEYDRLLLNLVDVGFTGTESELLDPILIPTLNQNSNLSGFQVVYPGPEFFPTGEGLLAAFPSIPVDRNHADSQLLRAFHPSL